MKSKVEIIDALKRCKEEQCHCDGCPYFPEDSCVDSLFDDVISLLNKSDFEVVEEVLQRSKKHDWLGTGISGEGYTLELLDVFGAPIINFDGEGNIL